MYQSDLESLLERLGRLRRRVRQVLWLYGLSWIVTVGAGLMLLVGWTDWLFHLDDAGTRLLLALTLVGMTGWVAYRRLIAPLQTELTDLELALQIERRYPMFRDSFSSTVQFLTSGASEELGSSALQQRVIRRTLKQVSGLEFDEVVHTRSIRRIASTAILLLITTATVVGLNPVEAATALQRLVFPLGNHPWPRQTQLQFVTRDLEAVTATAAEPIRAARGDSLELYLINLQHTGRLPRDLKVEVRDGSGAVTQRNVQRVTVRDDSGSRQAGLVNLLVREPVEFRAVGGDDRDMPWLKLDVVPPPLVEDLRLKLFPPPYTGLKANQLPPGVGHIEGWVGTRVEVSAKSSKRLGSAVIVVKDTDRIPLVRSSDGRSIQGSFTLKEQGLYSYWLDLRDEQGFGNQDAPRYEIRAQPDTVPVIDIEQPEVDLLVTPDAEVALRLRAKDDLGLKELRLVHALLGTAGPQAPAILPLWTPPEGSPAKPVTQQQFDTNWQLAPLQLQPGQQLQIHAEATDAYNLGAEHVGRSLTRTLTIVSPDEKQRELVEQELQLQTRLEQAFKLQSQISGQTAELQQQLDKAGQFRPTDRDQLHRVEQQQRQLAEQLQHPQDGAVARASRLLSEYARNKLPDGPAQTQLQQIHEIVKGLAEDHLPPIEDALTTARKLTTPAGGSSRTNPAESPAGDEKSPKPAGDQPETETPGENQPAAVEQPTSTPAGKESAATAALDKARTHQEAVRDRLNELVQELQQTRDKRDVIRDVQEVRDQQQKLNDEARELIPQTISKAWNDLTKQQRADLGRQSARQKDLARQIGELQQRLTQTREKLAESNPDDAQAAQAALEQLLNEGVAGKMDDVAKNMEHNNVGQALPAQQEILEQLQQLEAQLQNRPTDDTEQLMKQMQQARQAVDELMQKQADLMQKTAEAGAQADPQQREEQLQQLRKELQEQQQRVEDLLQRLRKTPAHGARDALRRASQRLQQAGEQLDRPEQAEDAERETLDDFQQAADELKQLGEQLEERLADELLERMSDTIRNLVTRQQGVLDETKRLEEIRVTEGSWTRGQLKSLINIAEVQRQIQTETTRMADDADSAAAFQQALQWSGRAMLTAAERLSKRDAGAETVRAEERALDQLAQIVKAIDAEQKSPMGQSDQPGQTQPSGSGGTPPDMVSMLAELRVLRNLQADINARRQSLAEKHAAGESLTDEEAGELQSLADDQATLQTITEKYAAEVAERLRKRAAAAADQEQAPPEESEPGDPLPEETLPEQTPGSKPRSKLDLDPDALTPE